MRTIAGFCLTATLLTAPAFAQAPAKADLQPQGAKPLASASTRAPAPAALADDKNSSAFSMGVLDRLTIKRGTERSVLSVAPIEKEQLGFAWRPGGKWGLTLDMTSRSKNDVMLPNEELSAGAYYQFTPRFRFGGGLTLNGKSLSSAAEEWTNRNKQAEAGVKVESAFSF